MAVQKKILTEALTGLDAQPVISNAGAASTKTLSGEVGTLALGKVGDIFERAYGPLVYAYAGIAEDTVFGTVLAGKGIVCNGNDAYNAAPKFASSDTLSAGQTVACMVAGAMVVYCRQVEAIKAAMNARVIMGYDASLASQYATEGNEHYKDVCVVEVNGLLDSGSSK